MTMPTITQQQQPSTKSEEVCCHSCYAFTSEAEEIDNKKYCPKCVQLAKSHWDSFWLNQSGKKDKVKDVKITDRQLQIAAKFGTPEQVKLMTLKAKEQAGKSGRDKALQEKNKSYSEQVHKPKSESSDSENKDESAEAMAFLMRKAGRNFKRPDEITYESTRVHFWNFFRQIVKNETGIESPVLNESEIAFMKNFIHWIIGSSEGEWSPGKSLYIWTKLGVGKSTIALAGHYVMEYYQHKYEWGARRYQFVNMDQVFVNSIATSDISMFAELAKGSWCIDELREDHFTIKHYGNDVSAVANMLSARHAVWKSSGSPTIITSNIPFGEKLRKAINDERLYDRINQQYTNCFLKGDNKRVLSSTNN